MTQVLPFPKEKTKRVLRSKKIEGQRLVLTVSLFSFILVAVLANEQVMKNQRPVYLIADNSPHSIEQVNRAIASAQPLNLFRDVEWEHRLAKKLAEENDGRNPASIPQRVSLMDHLRYGELAGKYHIVAGSSGASGEMTRIREIEYIDSLEVADRPVQIPDHEGFLMQYRALIPVEFEKVALAQTKDGVETWALISEQGEVGRASLRFDENGRFLGFKVQSAREDVSTQ